MSTVRDITTPKDQRGEPGFCGCAGKVSCECGWWMTHCGLHYYFGKPIICPYCSRSGSLLTYVEFQRPVNILGLKDGGLITAGETASLSTFAGIEREKSFRPLGVYDVKVRWAQGPCMGFDCPCGNKDLTLSDEELTCECGRIYRQIYRVEVKDP